MNPLGSWAWLVGVITLGAILLEVLAYKFVFKREYRWRSALASLAISVGRQSTRVIPLAVTLPGAYWLHEHRLFDASSHGGVLLLFDRLFGTYVPEREDLPCRFGLVHPLTTSNPLKIVFHQFGPFFRDVMSARSPREVWGYFFAPPGWRPDGHSETTEDLRRKAVVERQIAAPTDAGQTAAA
ncbi:hypothetical protein [Archangium sp.]|uniref:hypothetical protein n=1 Tax=Archangium sp. TaxID=1872627 RepID=UPI00286BAC6A|nr:hypothetical protein [Archangium sp.]